MKILSNGMDSTIKNWIGLCKIFLSDDGPAVRFLQKKADESPHGLDEEIIADEGQLIMFLFQIEQGEKG